MSRALSQIGYTRIGWIQKPIVEDGPTGNLGREDWPPRERLYQHREGRNKTPLPQAPRQDVLPRLLGYWNGLSFSPTAEIGSEDPKKFGVDSERIQGWSTHTGDMRQALNWWVAHRKKLHDTKEDIEKTLKEETSRNFIFAKYLPQ